MEHVREIQFGNFRGPLLFLETNKHRVISADLTISPEEFDELLENLPNFKTIIKGSKEISRITISPNSRHVIVDYDTLLPVIASLDNRTVAFSLNVKTME